MLLFQSTYMYIQSKTDKDDYTQLGTIIRKKKEFRTHVSLTLDIIPGKSGSDDLRMSNNNGLFSIGQKD